jgi:MGT family glycosyltransferase
MARFLFVTWDGGGTVPPAFGIAQALRDRGHEPVFAGQELGYGDAAGETGPAASFEARALAHGFRFVRLVRASATWRDDPPDRRFATAVVACPGHLRDVRDAVAGEPFDALLVDGLLFGALAAAEDIGLPTAVLATSTPSALAAPGGLLETRLLAAVNDLRAAAGQAAVGRLWDAWARFPTLCATVPALDPLAAEVPPSFAFVGPVFERKRPSAWRPPWDAADSRPLVLASFTTTSGWDQTSRIQRTLAALADRPYRVLVTAPRALGGALVVPANAVLAPHVPHGEILPHTGAVVTHAGHGTLAAALAHGVPVVCLPNPGSDQPALAARVAQLGAGRALDGEAATPEDIARAVDGVLADPSYAATAGRLAHAIAALPGAATAAAFLERMTAESRSPMAAPASNPPPSIGQPRAKPPGEEWAVNGRRREG